MSNRLVGHNSVQTPHNGRFVDYAFAPFTRTPPQWRQFEREQVRRERFRYIKQGRIIPFTRTPPQLMVKDENGNWKPEIKYGNN